MRHLRKRWLPLVAALVVIGGSAVWYSGALAEPDELRGAIVAPVRSGSFAVVVTTTGELRARKFVQIQGPTNAQMAGVYQTKISSLVPEGQLVGAGDVIAELDRGQAAARLSEVSLNLQKAEAQYTSAQLDSTLNLSQAREDVRTAEYLLEEKRLAREQAQFEAPTIRRQAEIDHEKAVRGLERAKANLQTKHRQAVAKMAEVGADRDRHANQLRIIQGVMGEFTVRAPAPGMVIYVREWNGKKKGVGSTWSPWEPTVATLPDLTEMESITYVNEVDVRKIGVGQRVTISLDADPSKRLEGKVTGVANVGEQRPNQDAKVFEVKIEIAGSDTTLRPGMTTANAIETATLAEALYVPIEAINGDSTGTSHVFKRSGRGIVKQEVRTGAMNDNDIVVLEGLAKDESVLLTIPPNAATLELRRLASGPAAPVAAPADSALAPVLQSRKQD